MTSLHTITKELYSKKIPKSKKCSSVITSVHSSARNVGIVCMLLTLSWTFLLSSLIPKRNWMFMTVLMHSSTIKLRLMTIIVWDARAEPHAYKPCAHSSFLRFWSSLSKDTVPLTLLETSEECSVEIGASGKTMLPLVSRKHWICDHLSTQRRRMWLLRVLIRTNCSVSPIIMAL